MTATALTREVCIPDNIGPNGRKYKLYLKANTSLLCITADDGKETPEALDGMFTDPTKAQAHLTKYLEGAWDYNDSHAERLSRKHKTEEIEVRRSIIEEAATEAAKETLVEPVEEVIDNSKKRERSKAVLDK